jgi:hypothetical protein
MWWMGVEWEEEERKKKKKKMKMNERVAMVRRKKVDLKIGKWCLICFLKCVLVMVMVGSD